MANAGVLLSFGVGLAAVGLIYAVVRLCRSRDSHSPLLAELLAGRVQYGLAGLVLACSRRWTCGLTSAQQLI